LLTRAEGKEKVSSDRGYGEDTTRKDPTQEYDEKEPMSPSKIKQHEPTAVRGGRSDQNIVEPGQKVAGANTEDATEKAMRSGMTKGTAGAD
jgi:hypothetical protein